MNKIVKVDKKYALNNSYFKNRKYNYPDTLLEIVLYWKEYGELPFEYRGSNWVYDTMVERQKRSGVINSQHLTPDRTAKQLVELTNNFISKDHKVLDACCGTGQLTKYLLENKFHVTGFDADAQMVEVCKHIYPQAEFRHFTIDSKSEYERERETSEKWDLIVSNPPYEQKELIPFFNWLSTSLTDEGKAILLLPKDFLAKKRPSKLAEYINRLNVLYQTDIAESFAHTQWAAEIYIVALSDSYKKTGIKQYKQIESKTGKIMEKEDLRKIQDIPLSKISINPLNPRKRIVEAEIEELALSIKAIGLLHPITLRYKDEKLQIVAGECRYRAFILNKDETIPAIIKDVTDEEVVRVALTENLSRKNLSPIEEGNGFLYFVENHKYTTEDLAHKFGKTESYIRGRLRLLRLTTDFRLMLEKDEITFTMAFELSKYSQEIQTTLYNEHFVTEGSTNWKDLGIKDFSGRVQRMYTMDLSKFTFDKTQCNTCSFNTEVYDLFTDTNQGRCTDNECLQRKRNEHTLNFCKAESEKNPAIGVCITPFENVKEDVGTKLKESGFEIKTVVTREYPVPPAKPDPSSFKMNFEYEQAMEDYRIEELAYYNEIEEVESKIEKGELKKFIHIGDNNPKICIAAIEKTNISDPVSELKKQDRKNKEAAMKSVYKESMEILKNNEIPDIEFSVNEDETYLFLLLDFLDKKNFIRFGITDAKKTRLSDEDKKTIIQSITPKQRAILQRDFIVRHFPNSADPNSRIAFLVPQFSILHFPGETQAIANKHMDVYKKSHAIIEDKIQKIEKAKGKKKLAEAL